MNEAIVVFCNMTDPDGWVNPEFVNVFETVELAESFCTKKNAARTRKEIDDKVLYHVRKMPVIKAEETEEVLKHDVELIKRVVEEASYYDDDTDKYEITNNFAVEYGVEGFYIALSPLSRRFIPFSTVDMERVWFYDAMMNVII